MSRRDISIVLTLALMATLCFCGACRPNSDEASQETLSDAEPKESVELLVFPDALRVEEDSVNEFVERAMAECASGDYERFRLLWSARWDPLPRGEYEEGWQAVQKIEVRALKEVGIAADPDRGIERNETGYALLANVELDPAHRAGEREPHREVVLMVIREHDRWLLARAPKKMRAWIKAQTERPDAAEQPPPQPRRTGD